MRDREPELIIAVVCLTLFCLLLIVAAARALPSGPRGDVVGCSDWAHGRCQGFWFVAHGGPTVYTLRGRPVPGFAFVDDTTPCGPGEPAPMNRLTAPVGSPACEQQWVLYDRRTARVVWAAAAGGEHFRGANATLREWYPAYGASSTTVRCGWGGYIVQRYLGGRAYPGFRRLWSSATRCAGTWVVAWL
jgi:hypothetical protein